MTGKSTKKAAAKTSASKTSASKKTASKATVSKKTASKASESKKTAAKKTASKTSASKKAASKKSASKASASKTASKSASKASASKTASNSSAPKKASKKSEPVLLSGGNPQIAKGDGDAAVQAYIEAMPGWKREVGRRLDALVVRAVPEVRKAVRWNSPFYGVEEAGWFLGVHCFTKYVKLAFFRGASLRPPPPVGSKDPETRYFHLHEGDALDEARLIAWFRQAATLPGGPPIAASKPADAAKASPSKRVESTKPTKAAKASPRGKAPRAAEADDGGASGRIDRLIAGLGDWRGERLAEIRALIREVDPEVVEEWKWMGTPVWSHQGIIALANAHKDKVKLTFSNGAQLADPKSVFNAGLDGNKWRAIDLHRGDRIDRSGLKGLLRAAIEYNIANRGPKSRGSRASAK